jgi:hypothetical protein
MHRGEEEGEEDPRKFKIITQKTHISIANIMEEAITLKRAQKLIKNISRIQQEKTMMNIASTMPNQFRPSFWQSQFMGSQPNPVTMQQFQQPQPSWQPSHQFILSLRQFKQFNDRNQFNKYYHHRLPIRQGQNRVQELKTRKLCLLLELSGPSHEDQLWSSKPKGRETITSDL